MTEFNPQLAAWQSYKGTGEAGVNNIEKPGDFGNYVWQTRVREPNGYEDAMAASLIAAYSSGVDELAGLVEHINANGQRQQNDQDWTAQTLVAELERLGSEQLGREI